MDFSSRSADGGPRRYLRRCAPPACRERRGWPGTGAQARRRRRRRVARNPAAPGAGAPPPPRHWQAASGESPPGPTSNSQPKTSATGKPSTAAQIAARIAASGIPNPGKPSAAAWSSRPCSKDVQRRGAEHLATSRVAIESNERLHCAGRNPRAFDRLGARFCKKPAARAILPSESRRHRRIELGKGLLGCLSRRTAAN